MAGIDKAAIAFSIVITAIGAGYAFVGESVDFTSTIPVPVSSPPPTAPAESSESETSSDPFADLAEKVKQEDAMMEEEEETMMMEEEEETMMMEEEETMMMEEEETMMMEEEVAGPQTISVDMPLGTSVPGCEETNECYIPANITINVGDTVEWINVDTAAHTVTAGSPADGPSGVFDSSLVMADAVYAFTFEEAGNYDYFCMVHPWMVGSVTVN